MELSRIKILAFGVIAEKIQTTEFYLEGITNTDELFGILYEKYPQLKEIKFAFSVNRNIVNRNVLLQPESEVALLPPFSGG